MTNSRMRIYLPGNQPPIHPGRLKQTAELREKTSRGERADEETRADSREETGLNGKLEGKKKKVRNWDLQCRDAFDASLGGWVMGFGAAGLVDGRRGRGVGGAVPNKPSCALPRA